ncbi:hypothetical protein Tco_1488404 [Tanacetum coccineum]
MVTTVFAATTPENMPFAYHASTSTNPNPMISPAFVKANYEVLEFLLRERRRLIRNEDLRTELEYFSEDYDEEQRERVMEFEEASNMEGSRRRRNAKGIWLSEIEAENRGVNLPSPLAVYLGRNESGQPLRSSLTFVQGGH